MKKNGEEGPYSKEKEAHGMALPTLVAVCDRHSIFSGSAASLATAVPQDMQMVSQDKNRVGQLVER